MLQAPHMEYIIYMCTYKVFIQKHKKVTDLENWKFMGE
jgi:hypothetical protein